MQCLDGLSLFDAWSIERIEKSPNKVAKQFWWTLIEALRRDEGRAEWVV